MSNEEITGAPEDPTNDAVADEDMTDAGGAETGQSFTGCTTALCEISEIAHC